MQCTSSIWPVAFTTLNDTPRGGHTHNLQLISNDSRLYIIVQEIVYIYDRLKNVKGDNLMLIFRAMFHIFKLTSQFISLIYIFMLMFFVFRGGSEAGARPHQYILRRYNAFMCRFLRCTKWGSERFSCGSRNRKSEECAGFVGREMRMRRKHGGWLG